MLLQIDAQSTADVLEQSALVFTLALALALVIERVLELLKSGYDLLDSHYDLAAYWTRRTERTRDFIESRLRIFEYVDASAAAGLLNRFSDVVLGPQHGHTGEVPILCGDLVRASWIRIAMKALGMAIGIGIAFLLKLDLLAFTTPVPRPAHAWSIAVTGAAIGLGSGIVHKLIDQIEKKRRQRTAEVSNA